MDLEENYFQKLTIYFLNLLKKLNIYEKNNELQNISLGNINTKDFNSKESNINF